MRTEQDRSTLAELFGAALAAVDPEPLTREALETAEGGPVVIVALGKAAAAMCRGAAQALGSVQGICVTNTGTPVPDGIELMIGDHPVPGERSFAAGRRALEVVASAPGRVIGLISGGGSSLCEHPIPGVTPEFIRLAIERLLTAGVSIDELNLVRRHLSAVKNGGLASRAKSPVETVLISDVCGADVAMVASGPTIYRPPDPGAAIDTMTRHGIAVPDEVTAAIERDSSPPSDGPVTVVGDGHTATRGLVRDAVARGVEADEADGWINGDVDVALTRFLASAGPGLTVATGEPDVVVTGDGKGGRNTHAALLAARRLAGTEALFAAFATDGVDGNTECAGAIVDGDTIARGGDPVAYLRRSDSASYLEATGDLISTGPTGTNVSDLWVVWK